MVAERRRGLGMAIPELGPDASSPVLDSHRGASGPAPVRADDSRLELVCRNGARPGERYPFASSLTRIGRSDRDLSQAPDIDLGEQEEGQAKRSISRQHAEIARYPEGLELVDMGSANGTWLNGVKLTPGVSRPLKCGDHVRLGRLELVVEPSLD